MRIVVSIIVLLLLLGCNKTVPVKEHSWESVELDDGKIDMWFRQDNNVNKYLINLQTYEEDHPEVVNMEAMLRDRGLDAAVEHCGGEEKVLNVDAEYEEACMLFNNGGTTRYTLKMTVACK